MSKPRIFQDYVEKEVAFETPTPEGIIQYFDFEHLENAEAARVSSAFYQVARFVDDTLDSGPEKSTALRKLLEAKDAAVRSAIFETVE